MILDWIGFTLAMVGAILAAQKNNKCWVVFAISNICWIVYAIVTKQLALLAECLGFLGINIYGWIKWNKK